MATATQNIPVNTTSTYVEAPLQTSAMPIQYAQPTYVQAPMIQAPIQHTPQVQSVITSVAVQPTGAFGIQHTPQVAVTLPKAQPIGTAPTAMPKSAFAPTYAVNDGSQHQPDALPISINPMKDDWLSVYRRTLWFCLGWSMSLFILSIVFAGFYTDVAAFWLSFATSLIIFVHNIRLIVAINKQRTPSLVEGVIYKIISIAVGIVNIILLAIDANDYNTENFGTKVAHTIFSAFLILFGLMLIAQFYSFALTVILIFRLRKLRNAQKFGYPTSNV